MALTPVDILHTQFKTTLRGYSKQQVDEFARSVREALETALNDKAEVQRCADALQGEVDRVRSTESTMANALTVAQKSADELKAGAHKQVELILKEAELSRVKMTADAQSETERLRTEIALLQATRDRFDAEFRAVLAGYVEWLDKRRQNDEDQAEVA